ncbi:MAG: hypothetical protein RL210_718 [Pseudomonadota bacterium]
MAENKPTVHSFGLGGAGGKFSSGYGTTYSVGTSFATPGKPASAAPATPLTPEQIEALFQRAQTAHKAGQLAAAEPLYLQLLLADAGHAPALHLLGMLYYQQGRLEQAAQRLRSAIAVRADATYFGHLGAVLLASGQPQQAEAAYLQALALQPDDMGAHYNLGVLYQQQQRWAEAAAAYRQALRLSPADDDCLHNLAGVLLMLGELAEAESCLRQLLAAQPQSARAHASLGDVLARQGRTEEARASLLHAAQLSPQQPLPQVLLGNLYWDLKQWDDAAQAYEQAARLNPASADALVKLAGMWLQKHDYAAVLPTLQRALAREPRHIDAHVIAADACEQQGLFQQSLPWIQQATELLRQSPDAVSAAAGSADARFSLALFLLRHGRLQDGWPLAEWRYASGRQARDAVMLPKFPVPIPMWRGEPLAGKVILLVPEQGHGDEIQFIRYARLLQARGARVWVCTKQPLISLLAEVEGVERMLSDSDQLHAGEVDFWVFPLSLPYHFDTTLETIPDTGIYLRVDPAKAGFWRGWLAQAGAAASGVRRVGLVWSGNPNHVNDRNRSIDFSLLAPLLDVPGVQWVSLQLGERAGDAAALVAAGRMLDPSVLIHDFSDSAALLDQLDLLISVDSAPVHLAGALGKPVWTLLPHVPDWRWLLDRDDSPWYGGVRLFRQPALQDWGTVVNRLQQALRQWLLL